MQCKLSLRWKLDLEQNKDQELEQALFKLLDAIQTKGSVKQAAQHVSVSYRYAWGLFQKWENLLGKPLILMQRGRGTTLTTAGKKLLESWQQAEKELSVDLSVIATRFINEFEPLVSTESANSLNLFASNDLAITQLRELLNNKLNQEPDNTKLDLHFHGSLESLQHLKEQHCDLAGFHIPKGKLGEILAPQYLPWLAGLDYKFIEVVTRHQGLIVAQNNPKQVTDINDLARDDVSFINRQPDSGTRLLLDQLLQQNSITAEQINGYENEEFTHTAVAALVASGAVDAGFGIAASADKLNLDFIPAVWEHYCLAIPQKPEQHDRAAQIINMLASEEFKRRLVGYSGYDTARSGEEISLEEILSR